MTTTMTRLNEIAREVSALDGVVEARLWTRVPGKERIYVELQGFNGRGPGVGQIEIHADGQVMYGRYHQWQGARTREWHRSNDTMGRIREIVERHVERHP